MSPKRKPPALADRDAAVLLEQKTRSCKAATIRPKVKPIRTLDVGLDLETSRRIASYQETYTIGWAEYVRRDFRRAIEAPGGPSELPQKKRLRGEPKKGRLEIKVAVRIDLGQRMICRPRAYWHEMAKQAIEAQLDVFDARVRAAEKSRAVEARRAHEWNLRHPGQSYAGRQRHLRQLDRDVWLVRNERRKVTFAGSRQGSPSARDVELGFAISTDSDGWLHGPLTSEEAELWAISEVEFGRWVEIEGYELAFEELLRREATEVRRRGQALRSWEVAVRQFGCALPGGGVTRDPGHPELVLHRPG